MQNLNRRRPQVSAKGQELIKNAPLFQGAEYFFKILNRLRPQVSAEGEKLAKNHYFKGSHILGKF